jgi:myosin heavy subunit
LFNILKEECKSQSNGEDDTVFVQKLNDYFGHNTDYIHFKNKPFNFGLNHYTGKTRYNGEEFLTKSKEFLSKNLIDCLQKSEDIFVSDLLTAMPAPNGSFSK